MAPVFGIVIPSPLPGVEPCNVVTIGRNVIAPLYYMRRDTGRPVTRFAKLGRGDRTRWAHTPEHGEQGKEKDRDR